MKKILGLVIILAVLVLGGYYGMGVITEKTVRENLDVINHSNGIFAKIVDYKRGWFTSTATLDWRLHVPERVVKSSTGETETVPAQDIEWRMPLQIYHGPIILANKTVKFGMGYAFTDIPVPDKYNQQFNDHFISGSTKPVLNLSLFVNYLKNSQVEMTVPDFKLLPKEGGQFEWKGMTSEMNVTSDAGKISGEFDVKGMDFQKDDTKAMIGNVTSTYNLHKTDSGLYLGDAVLSLPSIVVHKKDQVLFQLTAFTISSKSDIKDNLFATELKWYVEKIIADGKNFGPGKLAIELRNLDAVVLSDINKKMKAAQNGSDIEKQQAMLAILPEIPKLFSKGAEFEVSELSFVMPQGTIEGNLLINLPQGETSNPFEMIQKIHGKSKLRVPADVVKLVLNESNKKKLDAAQTTVTSSTTPESATVSTTAAPAATQDPAAMTETQINTMMQTGLIVQDGNYYVIEALFEQGKLQINGKPFDPAMVKF